MTSDKLDRINALARKSRETGLTPEEKAEQTLLREEYIAGFRASMHAALESVYVLDEDGKEVPIKSRRKTEIDPVS